MTNADFLAFFSLVRCENSLRTAKFNAHAAAGILCSRNRITALPLLKGIRDAVFGKTCRRLDRSLDAIRFPIVGDNGLRVANIHMNDTRSRLSISVEIAHRITATPMIKSELLGLRDRIGRRAS